MEKEHSDRFAYKQSAWASLIDGVFHVISHVALSEKGELSPSLQALADWAEWMSEKGYKSSLGEISQKTTELLETNDFELRMIESFLGKLNQ